MCLVKFAFAYTYAPLHKFCACFYEVRVTKVLGFESKQKMFLSDQGTKYQEILWFWYVSKIHGPKMAPQVGQISKILKIWKIDHF